MFSDFPQIQRLVQESEFDIPILQTQDLRLLFSMHSSHFNRPDSIKWISALTSLIYGVNLGESTGFSPKQLRGLVLCGIWI